MMPKSALELAARALCSLEGNPEDIAFEGGRMWESYVPQARAVLAVLREPTDVMMTAATTKGREIGYTDVVGVWRAMIDAAG